jgi:PAS domain S-box-containing protein
VPTDDRLRAELPREVFDHLLEGCQVIGFDLTYLYVNDAVVAQSRTTKEALLGRTMMECYPGIDQSPFFAVLQRCLSERTHGTIENEFRFPDGTRMWFELRFIPVPAGACILSLDITDRRLLLSAIVADSEDAIIGRTPDGVVTTWNSSAERIFGYTEAEMIGRSIDILFPEARAEEEAQLSERLLRGERIDHFETVRKHKDGREIDVSITLSRVRDAAGGPTGVSMIARDIGDVKRMQREIVLAKEAAEIANRELESFSYSVAHDLRSPLRSIDGFSQALTDRCGAALDDEGREYLGFVRTSAQHMGRLIDGLLTLARVTRSDLCRVPVDVSALAWASVERLRLQDPARVVAVSIEDDLTADADPRLLGVVLDNLLGNAWKFTSGCDPARIELCQVRQKGEVTYVVRDNGAGFDMAYAHKLFGVFQRLHAVTEFEGTGIGLATVQRIIHRHGGRVWAEGEPDSGAAFYFTLGSQERGV